MSSMAIEHFREHIEPKLQQTRLASLATIRQNLSSLACGTHHPSKIVQTFAHCPLVLPVVSSLKRTSNGQLRRLNNRIYKQTLVIKSQKYQMRHYRQLLRVRGKALKDHHRRLRVLEKKSKESEQLLVDIRNDNVTLLQRFDQFALLCEQPCSQPVDEPR